MIVFIVGPAGAGKSVQGQMLADAYGWRWLSMGQLLRDSDDPEFKDLIQAGKLVPADKTNALMSEAINSSTDVDGLVVDGWPRQTEQATYLVENQNKLLHGPGIVLVFDVPKEELIKRMKLRERHDDTEESIAQRLDIYKNRTEPMIQYLADQGIKIIRINGVGEINDIHANIAGLVKEHITSEN